MFEKRANELQPGDEIVGVGTVEEVAHLASGFDVGIVLPGFPYLVVTLIPGEYDVTTGRFEYPFISVRKEATE